MFIMGREMLTLSRKPNEERHVIRQFFASLLLLAICSSTRAATRPNIILILADDLGYGDLACFGGSDIPTPRIDSIAKAGVRFTQAYAYPTCSPTRAALMTGRYAEHFGVSSALMGDDAPQFKSATTIAQLLHDKAGYATGLVGKWHLGYSDEVNPIRKGFEEFFGFRGGKIDNFAHTDTAQKGPTPEGKHDLWEGEKEIHRDGYTTDLFTARSRKFIRDHAQKGPFFLYVAYNSPHYAKKGVWQAPEKYLARFNAVGKTQGRDVYRAMVACLDDGVGEILDELKAQNLEKNTLVIFMSDNGAEKPGSNQPLTGFKHTYSEGGVRVPWLARWPGVIPPGVVRDDVVHVTDIAPTLLAVVGITPPKKAKFDGMNVWQAFTNGPAIEGRKILFSNRGMRDGDWKALNGQLFDLKKDPQESTDLAAMHPEIRNRMMAESKRWAKEIGIPAGK
jgi:arylsulfatase A-like enzyme